MFSENAERSDVTWGQLAFDTESLGSLQRSNPGKPSRPDCSFLAYDDDHSSFSDETGLLSIDHEQCELDLLLLSSYPVQRIVFHRFLTSLGVLDIVFHIGVQKEPCLD